MKAIKLHVLKFFVFTFLATLVFSSSEKTEAAYPLGNEYIFYHFEDAATATSTNSGSAGSTHDGTLVGNASTSALLKRFGGRGAAFGETGDYMRTFYGANINPTSSSTSVSLWVNKNSNNCTSDADHVFGVSGSPTANRFYIRCNNSTTNKWGYRLQGNSEVFSSTIQAAGWDHIVLVASSTNDRAQFYINGTAIGSNVAYTTYSIPGQFYVGNYNDTVGSVLTEGAGAYIDEVAIYNDYALTPAEVTVLYKAGDAVAPVISAVASSSVTDTSIAFTWTTDENATTQIEYGTTGAWGSYTTLTDNVTFVTSHSQSITGLTAGTTYHYRVASVDPSGTAASSTDAVFTTTGSAPPSAPTITNVSSDTANGYYGAGKVIDIDVTFSEAVNATTSVAVTLETGTTDRTCSFTVSNSTTATCNYTVQTGDVTTDLTVSSVSGYIESQAGSLAMTDFAPATNLAANKAISIGEYLSFVTPTPNNNSTSSASTITTYASSTMFTSTGTTTTSYISLETPGGSVTSAISTTTRYGDYNLTHLSQVISASNLSINANSSGIAFVASSTSAAGSLYVVHNVLDLISEISVSGALLRTIACTSCGDIEGITLVSSTASSTAPGINDLVFMISTEDDTTNGEIFRVVLPSKGSGSATVTNTYTPNIAHGANTGLEGIAYNPTSGVFYLAEEKGSPTLYEYSLSGTAATICGNLDFTSIATDFSDLAYNNGILYVLSDENSRLIPVNITSTSTCAFVDSDGDGNTTNDSGDYLNSIPFTVGGTSDDQVEGVTWDNTGDYLYVIGEDDDLNRYRTNAYTVRHTFTGLSDGSYILKASSTDAVTGLTAFSPFRSVGLAAADITGPVISNIASSTSVTTATVTWDTDESSDSKVSYGTSSGTYTTSTSSASSVTSHSIGLTGLSGSTRYFYVAVSKDASGNYSTSTETSLITTAAPDVTPPVISNVASSTSVTTATVTWDTDESSDSKVSYGTSSGAYTTSTSSTALSTSHSLGLTGLSGSTRYFYVVVSKDASSNTSTSSETSLITTAAPDVTGPVISNIASSTSVTTATVTWDTDESSDSKVSYGTSSGTYTTSTSSASSVTSHSIGLTGLSGSTRYFYVVVSKDGSNNYSTSTETSLITTAAPDTTPPVISSIASSTTSTTATITWTTDESATSTVEYGATTSYGSASTSSTFTSSHSVILTGLTASTLYHFRVSSGDGSFNYATSTDRTFTTAADTNAPDPSNVETSVTSSTATITWDTDEAGSSLVAYGVTNSYSATTTETDTSPRVTSHGVTITGLVSCTTYYFRVASTDNATNTGYDSGSTFATSGCTGNANVENIEAENVNVAAGGDVNLEVGDQEINLEVPPNVASTSANLVFQIKVITDSNVVGSISSPSGTVVVDGQVYDLKAYLNATTTQTSFDEPIVITLTYSNDDVSGIDESTLRIYRYDGSAWVELDNCVVDTDANTVTCETDHFSVFGMFGVATSGNGGSSGSKPRSAIKVESVTGMSPSDLLIATLLARIAELKAELARVLAAQGLPPSLRHVFTQPLEFGNKNEDVRKLQQILNTDLDTTVALTGAGSKGNETIFFGAATKSAVIKFQLKYKLITSVQDMAAGFVGPNTRAKLNSL